MDFDVDSSATATTTTPSTTTTSSTVTSLSSPSPSPPPKNQSLPSDQPSQIPIQWPPDGTLTLDWVFSLMTAFDWASRNLPPSEFPSVLPVPDFDRLILCGSKILHKEPNCVRIEDVGENSTVVVVGDVHGQLHDVLFLLKDAGYPSENRVFVFNGDYVDRGAWGLETFLLLLAWKVCCW